MTSLKRMMEKELKAIKSKPSIPEDMMRLGLLYVDRKGRVSRRFPKGIPEPKPKPLVEGEGASYEDGIPVIPKLDKELRKRGKTHTP